MSPLGEAALEQARRGLMAALGIRPRPMSFASVLDRPGGCFVTLKRAGHLRGCIGRMQSAEPLGETLLAMARAAALEDPRFDPVEASELSELRIEVSLLTPIQPSKDPLSIEIGPTGLWIEGKGRRGVLLPQVAAERGWSPEEFLRATCKKAGLSLDAWKHPDVLVQVFQAEVFREDETELKEID